ncbi:MAG: glycine--tRNA ligase subunit beta [Burkholderiales bacterium]
MKPLLVELFTEELPPKALQRLGEAFAQGITEGLNARQLLDAEAAVTPFCTPRRLAVRIANVRAVAADQAFTEKLMPVAVGLKDGQPTPALLKKLAAKQLGHVDPATLERESDGKAEQLVYRGIAKGVSLAVGLQAALTEALAKLPIPKVMGYQLADGITTVHFVRPAHSLLALHGEEIVPVSVLGLAAGRVTHGHRFQGVRDIEVPAAEAYEDTLAAHGKVTASFTVRRAEIERQLRAQAAALGASLGNEADVAPLLDEVTALVEQPAVYAGAFDAEFLAVPPECLILTMRANQKYFPLFDATGQLSNRFLIVSNMQLADPRTIIEGNQRVIRPRLADARFFFETDQKTRLADRVPQLANVVYHNKLGSQGERIARVRTLATAIARMLGADPAQADRAALLAKADLVTNMVGEFPELQGIMGRYYALADGEDAAVADAIRQHYQPRFAGDALPTGAVATAVALADKLETLAGLFGIGQQPTGDKDPFALRRHALGVVRMLVDGGLAVPLPELVRAAFAAFPAGLVGAKQAELEQFVHERLRGTLRDEGFSANETEAVLSLRPARLDAVPKQLAAVRAFAGLAEAESLAAANKRVVNILKQAEAKGDAFTRTDAAALVEPAEKALFAALQTAAARATPLFDRGDYTGYLQAFAVLKGPVDAFFDAVMVNAEDPALRRNRLALLADLRREMNRVADLSKLAA